MLLCACILGASTTPIPANPMAPSVIAAKGAWSIALVPGDGDQLRLQAGDGGPMPLCAPGKPCNIDQLKLQAGDGGPMPLCAPGKPCNIDQLKLQAGDGGPMPLCAPGKPCNIEQERLLMAL
jgi:hypothetical protein